MNYDKNTIESLEEVLYRNLDCFSNNLGNAKCYLIDVTK